MRCPKCGAKAEGDAAFCKRCGAPLGVAGRPPARRGVSPAFTALVILAGVIALVVGAYALLIGTGGAATAPAATADGAYDVCRQFVSKRLKAPATANFPTLTDAMVSGKGTDRIVIRAYVDSDNSFGAHIRSAFACDVQWQGGTNWRLVSLDMQ